MVVHVQAFGILKDFLGSSEVQWNLSVGITAKGVRAFLKKNYPVHPGLPIAVVRDNRYLADDEIIQDQDHLFLMPPVSGG